MWPRLPSGRIASFLRCCRGATAPEYAILILAVTAVLLFTLGPLGQHVARSFSNAGDKAGSMVVSADTPPPTHVQDSEVATTSEEVASWKLWASALGVTFLAIALVRKFYRPQTRQQSTSEPRPLAKNMRDPSSPTSVEKRQQIARRLYKHAETLLQGDIEVRHLMTSSPVSVRPQAAVAAARQVMEDQCLDYLLVCDADGKLRGLVSHYYLQCTRAKRVADAMLPNPLFVTSQALLSPTVTHMLNQGVSCVAVVEHDRAIGMITTMDIQLTLQAALQVLARSAYEKPSSEFPSTTTA